MKASAIKTGFYRIGVVLAAVICALAFLLVVLSAFGLLGLSLAGQVVFGVAGIILAATAYGIAWALGWVFSGLSGDETSAAPDIQNRRDQ